LINHLSGAAVGWDFMSVAPRMRGGYKNNQGHSDRRSLGKGLPPRLSFVCDKSHNYRTIIMVMGKRHYAAIVHERLESSQVAFFIFPLEFLYTNFG
jgi:hypothetical protein